MQQNKTEKGTLLVIDDDLNIHNIVTLILNDEFNILTAENGLDAINILNEQLPDFILIDWNMPKMNGLEFIKKIKSIPEFCNIPIIMMTGFNTDSDALLAAYNEGVVDFLKKPFDYLELKARTNAIYKLATLNKNELMQKNNELTLLALKLAEVNQFIRNFIEKLNENDDIKNKDVINDIKRILDTNILNFTWNEFSEYFTKINPHFNKNLVNKHHDLTPSELKLASLLKLNLSTKEISSILHQTIDSIKVSRSRLRKKFNLNNDDNLIGYIMNF